MILNGKRKKAQRGFFFKFDEDPSEQSFASLAKIADSKFVSTARQLAYFTGQLRKLIWK